MSRLEKLAIGALLGVSLGIADAARRAPRIKPPDAEQPLQEQSGIRTEPDVLLTNKIAEYQVARKKWCEAHEHAIAASTAAQQKVIENDLIGAREAAHNAEVKWAQVVQYADNMAYILAEIQTLRRNMGLPQWEGAP